MQESASIDGCICCLKRLLEDEGGKAVDCVVRGSNVPIRQEGCPDFVKDLGAVWQENLEYESIQIKFPKKPDQSVIKGLKAAGFKWSWRQEVWYAKDTPKSRQVAEGGARYGGQVGKPLSIEEKVERKLQRAENRAEKYTHLSGKLGQEAQDLSDKARKMGDIIPLGQPILVGHHSEGRDRNYRGKVQRTFEKSVEASRRAEEYAHKAEAAAEFRNRTFDTGTVLRRIEKLEKERRRCNIAAAPQLDEEIAYWKKVLAESGDKIWGPKDFRTGERIKTQWGTALVEKVNRKTLTVRFEAECLKGLEKGKIAYNNLLQDCKCGVQGAV